MIENYAFGKGLRKTYQNVRPQRLQQLKRRTTPNVWLGLFEQNNNV